MEEAKRRQAEELEEARQRAEEQERLRKAESERVKLLLEKRKRERIFGVTVFLLGSNHADCHRSLWFSESDAERVQGR